MEKPLYDCETLLLTPVPDSLILHQSSEDADSLKTTFFVFSRKVFIIFFDQACT